MSIEPRMIDDKEAVRWTGEKLEAPEEAWTSAHRTAYGSYDSDIYSTLHDLAANLICPAPKSNTVTTFFKKVSPRMKGPFDA